ncbi:MAG: glycyl radical protein [Ignavibacteria bacterium]|nr:glycyl radical protein [Ignavibacteria bacterium]
MTERITRLRTESLNAINSISDERALLLTEFYQATETACSIPVTRAMAFQYILEHKSICINPGELIVGERGPAIKAVPTYPEVCLHSLEDLRILNSREKVPYHVPESVMHSYELTVIPYWKGKTQRERIFAKLDDSWKAAYNAGIFTEFQEQRAPGHTVNGNKIYHKGMLDIIEDIRAAKEKLDYFNDPHALAKADELEAMEITAAALITFGQRHADSLEALAATETDVIRKDELLAMAKVCRRVPAHKPETFHEALQYYWFVHVGVVTELNPWDSFNPGRLDQHLFPFYQAGLADGSLTEDFARELLQAFWVKFNNHPAPPKVGVTARESGTYTDFALINVGGVKADGSDAVNDLTYVILDVIEEMRLLQPSSMVQVSKKNPERFVHRAARIIKTGFGQPSVFNTDAIIQQLIRQGKAVEDARNGGASGCVETGAFGTESYILTGYFNLVKIFEVTLHNGADPRTGKLIGLQTGTAESFTSFDDLLQAYAKQVQHFADIKIKGNNIIEQLYATYIPAPFLSLLIEDCIGNGTDYNAGGARYNTNYIQGVGLGTLTDILTSVKYHVYDKKSYTMQQILAAIGADFAGYENMRVDFVYKTPKYGNDDDYADAQAIQIFEIFYNAVNGRPTTKGGTYRINLLPTTCHVYFGSVTLATPDGRKAGEPLSEGISPVQGADTQGPTGVVKSAAKLDHIRTGGTLLNQKFTPHLLETEAGLKNLVHLIRSYFRMDGHHIQFNVVSAATLREAQQHPEKYRDLIVRVAGYSDYFNDLSPELQNEIIRRTEHGDF